MRAIVIIAVALVLTYAASAARVCQDTSNKDTNPFCNTTALQAKLPAKACAASAGSTMTDFTFFCTQASYDAWTKICPKKNTSPEGFCTGTGQPEGFFCLLQACSSDSDCATPDAAPTSQKPCYNCCQVCQEDSYCDANSGSGSDKPYAAKDSTDCISCAAAAPTKSSSATCVAPVLALMGAAALL